MPNYIYGIDFGTTNSALAILDTETNNVVKVFSTPSLLFFPDGQSSVAPVRYSVGHEAVERYVSSRMSGRFMKSIKRVLPNKSFVDTRIAHQRFKAEDLVALILGFLKKQADGFTGQNITTAVIGRPVVFDENPEKDAMAQERLAAAARIAGFTHFYFQMEPIGAAFTYERQMDRKELVLVGDFGGGTSDFSLMTLDPASVHQADRAKDMMAQGGIYIGGDSFDSDIMWHRGTPHFGRGVQENIEPGKWMDLPLSYFHNICSWSKMNFLDTIKMRSAIRRSYTFSGNDNRVQNLLSLIEKNLGYSLFQEIESAKIQLAAADLARFAFDREGIQFEEQITIEDFETEIIHKNLEKIDHYLQEFLDQQQISAIDIDTVFLTGGTSMIRPLRNRFVRRFGADRIKSGDNFISVAVGLAYSYKVLSAANRTVDPQIDNLR